MATFRGTIQGQRGEASRLGSAKSGLAVRAASWSGAVDVRLFVSRSGVDMCEVTLAKHFGAGVERLLYRGPVSGSETLEVSRERVAERGAA